MTQEPRSSDGAFHERLERRASVRPSLLPFGQPLPAEPLLRWPDQEAPLPALRARLRRAEKQRDVGQERTVAAEIARALVAHRCELDIAVRMARRAVLLGDDGLRVELANWHCHLGQTELAVGMLAPLLETPGAERAALLTRMALYWARLNNAENALAALREAVAYEPADPLTRQLLGMVYGWAPGATSSEQAADAYLMAARCHDARGDTIVAQQDRLRAFDTAPDHSAASNALAATFRSNGKPSLALEVERRHAMALVHIGRTSDGRRAHRDRMLQCVRAHRYEEALAAALQAGMAATIHAEGIVCVVESLLTRPRGSDLEESSECSFDELLAKLGLLELLAVRLELAAEATHAVQRGRCYRALGALLERIGSCGERAFDAFLESAEADPGASTAFEPFRRHARETGDPGPLLEALMAVARDTSGGHESIRRDCLVELLRLAEGRLADPGLALWCVEKMDEQCSTVALQAARVALAPEVARVEIQLNRWLAESRAHDNPTAGVDTRVQALRRLASLLRLRPHRELEYQKVLEELIAAKPEELRAQAWLERLLRRTADFDALGKLWERQLGRAKSPAQAQGALLGLSRIERRAGNLPGALAVVAADDNRGLRPVAALQLSLAAQLGHEALYAAGILKLATGMTGVLRGWLASVASAELLQLGQRGAAVHAAEVGTRAAPELAAPLVAYANAVMGRRDRIAAVAFERAMTLTFPSSNFCEELVEILISLHDVRAAQAWTSRWLSLRPSATPAAVRLLELAAQAGDAATLGDVVAWAVGQAHPIFTWAAPLAEALSILALGDRARASKLSWSLLNAFGPHPEQMQLALLDVAESCQNAELKTEVLERRLATETGDARCGLLLELAAVHEDLGSVDQCLATLVRALAVGASPQEVLQRAEALPNPTTPQGQYFGLQVQAWGLELSGEGGERCWRALRQFGAAQWDLARDPVQATETWLRAAELLGAPSWVQFVLDCVEVKGFDATLEEVYRLAETRDVPEQAAALLTAAAFVALRRGFRSTALQLAQLSLDTDPGSVNALGLLEASATFEEATLVENAYRSALGATKGRFGERSVHFRAACYFEAKDPDRALRHALSAFRAIPSGGGTFSLLLRLADSQSRADLCCQVLQDQANSCSGGAQANWLRKAALLAVHCPDGAERRTGFLLQALVAEPDCDIVDLLGFALADFARVETDGRTLGLLRLEGVVVALLPRLEFWAGARIAIALAILALSGFSSSSLALRALNAAICMDPDLKQYSDLLGEVELLSDQPEHALGWLRTYDEQTEGGKLGSLELLELALEIAARVAPSRYEPGFATRKAQRLPTDDSRERAQKAVQASRESELPAYVVEQFPIEANQALTLAQVDEAVEQGDPKAELDALSKALKGEVPLSGAALSRLIDLASEAGQIDVAEQSLSAAQKLKLSPELIAGATSKLAAHLLENRRPQRALRILLEASRHFPDDQEILTLALSAARAAGEDERRQEILQCLIDASHSSVKKGFWLNEAWEVAKKRGQSEIASHILRQWLASDPEDTKALEHLESECEAGEHWAELVELLERHYEVASSARERRRLVLRRCELLANRLGKQLDAQQLLAKLALQSPADRTVIEKLAEATENLGDKAAAAEAWFSASGLSSTRAHAAVLAERACTLYFEAGEPISARRVLAAPQAFPRSLALAQLAVRLERSCGNQPALAQRLVELSEVQRQPTDERASALLEAANLWRRLGDDVRACDSASKAAGWLPDDPEAQVLSSYLDSRLGRARTPQQAQRTVERLRRVQAKVAPGQRDLAGFLLVEAVEIGEGAPSAIAEIHRLHKGHIKGPLMAVALAECLVREKKGLEALDAFDGALVGDLRGLRQVEKLALEAARVAQRCGVLGRAHRYLRRAEADPTLQEAAHQLRSLLEHNASDPTSVRSDYLQSSPFGASLSESPEAEVVHEIRSESTHPDSTRPTSQGMGEEKEGGSSAPPKSSRKFRPLTAFEGELYRSLEEGNLQAGRQLLEHVLLQPERGAQSLELLRAWWLTRPGEPETIARFIGATDGRHRLALQHLSECWGNAANRDRQIPELADQLHDAEAVGEFIFHGEPGAQRVALGIVWDGIKQSLSWPESSSLRSQQPTVLGSSRPVASVFFAAAARMGLGSTPLIETETLEEPRFVAAMAQDVVVVVRGAGGRNGARLRFELGRALARTLPALSLVGCGSDTQIQDVLQAVDNAFGPPKDSRTTVASIAQLAATLWETVPASGQRALTKACAERGLTELSARAMAYRVSLRAGLFVSGDLGIALYQVCRDEHLDVNQFQGARGLVALADASHMARELIVLAASEQYARIRWSTASKRKAIGETRRGL